MDAKQARQCADVQLEVIQQVLFQATDRPSLEMHALRLDSPRALCSVDRSYDQTSATRATGVK